MRGVQEDAIATIIRLMRAALAKHPETLFVMGSYRIGKERAYLGAARALGCRVHVSADKLRVGPVAPPGACIQRESQSTSATACFLPRTR